MEEMLKTEDKQNILDIGRKTHYKHRINSTNKYNTNG